MGRKKKKMSKPWCWYCNREFDDEKILIQHQKAKHFKCHICYKKLYTGPGLAIHCMQVHKEAIDQVPNSLPNRSNIEIEIYGMEGIPPNDLKEHERERNGGKPSQDSGSDDDEPAAKKNKTEGILGSAPNIPGHPGLMPGMMPPMGMPPQFQLGPMMGPMGPMGPSFMGPHGMRMPMMAGPPPMMGGGQQKPLFPSAAPATSSPGLVANHMGGGAVVGADFKPISSTSTNVTFSTNVTISAPPTTNNQNGNNPNLDPNKNTPQVSNLIATSGAASKIIHPQEDVSLEELMARLPKYQQKIPQVTLSLNQPKTPTSQCGTPTSASSNGSHSLTTHTIQQNEPTSNSSTPTTSTEQQIAAAVQQKQAEELSRAVMLQRFHQQQQVQAQAAMQAAQAAAAAAAAQMAARGGPPGAPGLMMPPVMTTMPMTIGGIPGGPAMRGPATLTPPGFLSPAAGMLRPPMGLPPGFIGMPPGMVTYGAPMGFPGGPMLAPMMQPRFR